MKKVLWTTLFWLLVVVGFAGYVRFFDQGEVKDVMNSYVLWVSETEHTCPVCACAKVGSSEISDSTVQYTDVMDKLHELANKIEVLENTVASSPEDIHHTGVPVSPEKNVTLKTYPTQEALLQAEPNCTSATDGVNTYFGEKLMASTMIGEPENFVPEWKCIDAEQGTTSWEEVKNQLSQEEQYKAFLERQSAQEKK